MSILILFKPTKATNNDCNIISPISDDDRVLGNDGKDNDGNIPLIAAVSLTVRVDDNRAALIIPCSTLHPIINTINTTGICVI